MKKDSLPIDASLERNPFMIRNFILCNVDNNSLFQIKNDNYAVTRDTLTGL